MPNRIWMTARFIFIAIPGILLFLSCSFVFSLSVFDAGEALPGRNLLLYRALSFIGIVAGLLLSLYGTGRWGQWKQLITFVSIPVLFPLSMFLLSMVTDSIDASLLGAAGATGLGAYFVRRFLDGRKAISTK